MKEAREAESRLRRLGQVGLLPHNCRQIQAACVQAAVLFGAELWWKSDGEQGTKGAAGGLQKLANQEARAATDLLEPRTRERSCSTLDFDRPTPNPIT